MKILREDLVGQAACKNSVHVKRSNSVGPTYRHIPNFYVQIRTVLQQCIGGRPFPKPWEGVCASQNYHLLFMRDISPHVPLVNHICNKTLRFLHRHVVAR